MPQTPKTRPPRGETSRKPPARRAERPRRRTQAERSETTTRQIVNAARKRFRRGGFAATSIDAVVADAGVTKGAFYHHFENKSDLFEAVFVAEHEDLFAKIAASATSRRRSVRDGMIAGFRAFIEGTLDPGVQQVIVLDAPGILGWEKMREVEGRMGMALLREGIERAVATKQMRRRDPPVLAHLLEGLAFEGAMYIARSEDQQAARRAVDREFKAILDGLFA